MRPLLALAAAVLLPLPLVGSATPAGAARAHECGSDFRKVVSKPIRTYEGGERIGTLVIKLRDGSRPAYCGDAVFTGAWTGRRYQVSLFLITDSYYGQHYDSTYSPSADPHPVCLSTAEVPTGNGLRLQVRVFDEATDLDRAFAGAAGRTPVRTTPTVPEPRLADGPRCAKA